jgi:hypothetical protein
MVESDDVVIPKRRLLVVAVLSTIEVEGATEAPVVEVEAEVEAVVVEADVIVRIHSPLLTFVGSHT